MDMMLVASFCVVSMLVGCGVVGILLLCAQLVQQLTSSKTTVAELGTQLQAFAAQRERSQQQQAEGEQRALAVLMEACAAIKTQITAVEELSGLTLEQVMATKAARSAETQGVRPFTKTTIKEATGVRPWSPSWQGPEEMVEALAGLTEQDTDPEQPEPWTAG